MNLIDKDELLKKYPECRGLREKLETAPTVRAVAYTDKEIEILQKAIIAYGVEAQAIVALEELAELQKEICKALRGRLDAEHMAEEIADAEIMIEQLKLMFDDGAFFGRVDDYRRLKLLRLNRRIGKAEECDE